MDDMFLVKLPVRAPRPRFVPSLCRGHRHAIARTMSRAGVSLLSSRRPRARRRAPTRLGLGGAADRVSKLWCKEQRAGPGGRFCKVVAAESTRENL